MLQILTILITVKFCKLLGFFSQVAQNGKGEKTKQYFSAIGNNGGHRNDNVNDKVMILMMMVVVVKLIMLMNVMMIGVVVVELMVNLW